MSKPPAHEVQMVRPAPGVAVDGLLPAGQVRILKPVIRRRHDNVCLAVVVTTLRVRSTMDVAALRVVGKFRRLPREPAPSVRVARFVIPDAATNRESKNAFAAMP